MHFERINTIRVFRSPVKASAVLVWTCAIFMLVRRLILAICKKKIQMGKIKKEKIYFINHEYEIGGD